MVHYTSLFDVKKLIYTEFVRGDLHSGDLYAEIT